MPGRTRPTASRTVRAGPHCVEVQRVGGRIQLAPVQAWRVAISSGVSMPAIWSRRNGACHSALHLTEQPEISAVTGITTYID